MDIFQLLKIKTIKELKNYLKDNSIQYKMSSGNLNFKATYFGISFTVDIDEFQKKISTYSIVMDKEKYSYQQMVDNILKIKTELINVLGKPKLDNTNHLNADNIYVEFKNEDVSISLVCKNMQKYDDYFASIEINNKKEFSKNIKKFKLSSKKILWISSLIGGFFWGLAMYLCMGAIYGYTPLNFTIYMIGGAIFGILFAILFGLFNKNTKNNQIRKIIKEFSLENDNDLIKGIFLIISPKTLYPTKRNVAFSLLKITDTEVIAYSLVKNKQLCLKMPLKEAFYEMQNYAIKFKKDDTYYLFSFGNDENFDKMEKNLFSKLIDLEKFSSLFLELKKVTMEFNPYSIYDNNNDEILDESIKKIAKILFVKEDIDKKDLEYLICNAFSHDEYYAESLLDNYYDVFTKFIRH